MLITVRNRRRFQRPANANFLIVEAQASTRIRNELIAHLVEDLRAWLQGLKSLTNPLVR
jgi:hypothetical protein